MDNNGDECDSAAGDEERTLGSPGHAPYYITLFVPASGALGGASVFLVL